MTRSISREKFTRVEQTSLTTINKIVPPKVQTGINIWPLTTPKARRLLKVLRKFTAHRREDAPTNSRGKTVKSTDRAGHRVYPL